MSKRNPTTSTAAPITVYEVRQGANTHQLQATNTQTLRKQLSNLLPTLPPYSLQAAAHLAATERATVTGAGWSVRRVGVLQFVADTPPAARNAKPVPQLAPDAPQRELEAPYTESLPVTEL